MGAIVTRNDNLQKRYDFGGTTMHPDWSVVSQGVGQSVTIANSLVTVNAGTTPDAETVVRCKNMVNLKLITRFIARLSQRIANQSCYLELVNEAGDTYVRWLFQGTSATTAHAETANRATANSAVSTTIPNSANFNRYEIYAELEQVFFSAVATNVSTTRSAGPSFDRFILEPDENYFVQIRVLNGPSAPASNTSFEVDCVLLEDITTLGVEIVRGDGASHPATAMPTYLVGGSANIDTIATITTANTSRKATRNTETTSNLAANATFTGSNRDTGTNTSFDTFRVFCSSDVAGILSLQQGSATSAYFTTKSVAVTPGQAVVIEDLVAMRYVRVTFQNGPTATTALKIDSVLLG